VVLREVKEVGLRLEVTLENPLGLYAVIDRNGRPVAFVNTKLNQVILRTTRMSRDAPLVSKVLRLFREGGLADDDTSVVGVRGLWGWTYFFYVKRRA